MSRTVKRLADAVLALFGLVVTLPITGLAALAIWLSMGRPILFRQPRAGYRGRTFMILKFRTMREAYDERGQLLPDAERLTPVGELLRKLSIDELPQLWNVLRGEMSLVGPRPLLVKYLPLYSPEQARRHEVLPGITGWAQIHGRNDTTWEERLRQDVWYVDHWSLTLDLQILLQTLLKVLRREGIAQEGQATMEEFKGTPDSTAGKREEHCQ
ncbi:MAG: sugar transferase [Candidatus Zipacnadales bacterium]